MWIRSTTVLVICMVAGTSAANAAAASERSITLDEAIALTVERNPALVAAGYQLEAQQGRILQAELRPNIALDFEVENFAGGGQFSGVDSTETTLGLQWVIERGKRQGRSDVARAQLSLLDTDRMIQRLGAAASTAQLYLDALEMQTLRAMAEEWVLQFERLAAAADQRVKAGRSPQADLARARAALSEQRLVQEDYDHLLAVAIHRLAAQWGETRPQFTRVEGNPNTLPALQPYEVFQERLQDNPTLTRFLTQRRVQEATLRLAKLRAKPNWQLRTSIRHFEIVNEQALVAGIQIPIGKNRNQGRIAAAQAELAMSEANSRATRVQLETELFALYQDMEHELHIAEVFRDEILPNVESALRETEKAYEAGRYSYLDLRGAQEDAFAARRSAIVAAVNANRAMIELERLTGTTLDGREGE